MNRSKNKVRYAVVGLGHIAQVAVLPAFKTARNSELYALVSGDPEKLRKIGKQYNIAHRYPYEEYSRALSNVDAVYLAVPNHLHCEYAVRAAAAGVQVLCEKPMAPTSRECREMIEAANRNHVKRMIAYRLHFEAGNLEAVKLANSGRLGDIRFFSSEFAQQVADENVRIIETVPGAVVHGATWSLLHQCGALSVRRSCWKFAPSGTRSDQRFERVEKMVSAVLRFPENGSPIYLQSAPMERRTLVGSEGILRADPAYEYAEGIRWDVTIAGKKKTRSFLKRDQFAAELAYFSNCILRNKQPEPSGLEGLADVRVIEAVYHSIHTRRTVAIPQPTREKERPDERQKIHRPAHVKPEVFHAHSASREAA